MVERLVANEKVEGSTPFARSKYRAEGFSLCPLEAAATGTPIIVTEGGSTNDYFKKDFGLQVKSEFINSNKRKYLDPNLEFLVENISLIIENLGKYGNKKGLNLLETIFPGKKQLKKYIMF